MLKNITGVSKTSAGPLFLRARAGIPYAKEIAELTDATSMLGEIVDPVHHPLMERYFARYMELRFMSLSMAIHMLGYERVFEVAAGFATRGLMMSEHIGFDYLETDMPPVIEAKQILVREMLPFKRVNLSFAPADALNLESLLKAKSLLRHGPLALVHEGLLTYFPHKEKQQKQQVLENFRATLRRGDVWVTPDIITREQLERTTALSKEYLSKWPTFYPFEDEDEAADMITQAGFSIESLSPLHLVPYLTSEVPDDPRVREILAHEELWVMRPR